MGKKMMILGAGPLQVPAIQEAKKLGYEIILVDYDKDAAGFPLADVKLVVSTLDQEEVYRQALIYQPDVVITSTSDGPVRTAAYVNERLGKRPDLSYEDSLCATIKSYMRNRLKEKGVPVPQYYIVENFAEFRQAIKALPGICILKPSDNAGSRGVVLLRNAESKTEEELKEIYEYTKGNSRNGTLMVEEFMTGPEVSVEAVTIEGVTEIITITDKITTPPPYFVELAHSEPSCLEESVQEQIREITKKAVAAIRLNNGPSHTEIKVTDQGPKIVELAARLGGDFITSRLVPLSTGVDLVGSSVRLAVGEEVDLKQKWNRGAAIRFIPGSAGVIRRITVDERVYSMEGIEEVSIYKKAGDRVRDTRSSNDRLGHVIATGDTPKEALERASKALSYISVEEDYSRDFAESL